ncbi:hypothetical protein PFISCL1PPCAC_3923, partial [Pristionchus fissidentatus]
EDWGFEDENRNRFEIGGINWKLEARKEYDREKEYVKLSLIANEGNKSIVWSCDGIMELQLISPLDEKKCIIRTLNFHLNKEDNEVIIFCAISNVPEEFHCEDYLLVGAKIAPTKTNGIRAIPKFDFSS